MRLERYLNERYMTAVKHNGDTFEIFKNPSKKELKEAFDFTGRGYRFLIDFRNKNYYVWPETMFHEYAMTEIKKTDQAIPTFHAYWYKGKGSGWIFTGSYDGMIQSDYTGVMDDNDTGEDYLKFDWSWLKKYLSTTALLSLRALIDDTIAY